MNIASDLQFALRSSRSRIGLTLFAVGSLAVGMAAAITISCVIGVCDVLLITLLLAFLLPARRASAVAPRDVSV